MDARCIECGAKATLKCSQCHAVEYCSKNCQREHWEDDHADVCFNIAQPDREHVREMLEACAPEMLRQLDYDNVHQMHQVAKIASRTTEETIDVSLKDRWRRFKAKRELRKAKRGTRYQRKTRRTRRKAEYEKDRQYDGDYY